MLVKNGTAFIGGHLRAPMCAWKTGKSRRSAICSRARARRFRSAAGAVCAAGACGYSHPRLRGRGLHAQGKTTCAAGDEGLLKTGVAAFMPTTMSAPIEGDQPRCCERFRRSGTCPGEGRVAVLGAHMEAPFLCEKYKGAQLGECLMNPSVEAYEAMTRDGLRKMMTLAPELPGALDMMAYLEREGRRDLRGAFRDGGKEVHAAADRG